MVSEVYVTKRNGQLEPFSADKIRNTLVRAGCSQREIEEVEEQLRLQVKGRITASEIHDILIQTTKDLILRNYRYQYIAARLLLMKLYKDVFGTNTPKPFSLFVEDIKNNTLYDTEALNAYTKEELVELERTIKPEDEHVFTYAGLQQLIDKYLVRDRKTGKVYETPAYAMMLLSMAAFYRYEDKAKRLQLVKDLYSALVSMKINVPTPVLSGLRTKVRQFSSCVLVDCGDSINSISTTVSVLLSYGTNRAGFGINVGRIRPVGSSIRNGTVVSTGVIPFIRLFESSLKATTQSGVRTASGTVYFPFWHPEVLDLLKLKDNSGTEFNRVRSLDYALVINDLFIERLLKDKEITLFSPNEDERLYTYFADSERFRVLYEQLEKGNRKAKRIPAREVFREFTIQRLQTGRIYLMNIDEVNRHGPFKDSVYMSNLCTEVTQPTSPLSSLDDCTGEVSLCTLSAFNVSRIDESEYPYLSELVLRLLDEIIEHQYYPFPSVAEKAKHRRNVGIGVNDFAHWLAKNGISYNNPDYLKIHQLAETIQYSLIQAGIKLAKEKGPCGYFNKSKYSDGILPIDTYNHNVDKLVSPNLLKKDWEALRKELLTYGSRFSTYTAIMPCESSSVVSNSTNGIEPPRHMVTYKNSKYGPVPMVVPGVGQPYFENYVYAWEIDNKAYMNVCAIFQKFFDQAISVNTYYRYDNYENGMVPLSIIADDLLYGLSLGLKTFYYCNTEDGNNQLTKDTTEHADAVGCSSGACTV